LNAHACWVDFCRNPSACHLIFPHRFAISALPAAYTRQTDHKCGPIGVRAGSFYCLHYDKHEHVYGNPLKILAPSGESAVRLSTPASIRKSVITTVNSIMDAPRWRAKARTFRKSAILYHLALMADLAFLSKYFSVARQSKPACGPMAPRVRAFSLCYRRRSDTVFEGDRISTQISGALSSTVNCR
jgi:hypothetical protein